MTERINLYEKVANHISRLIGEGTFSVGDRIPSVRKLHSDMKVSITTVMEAYRLLEDQGIIEAHPQSGYYVRPQFPKMISSPEVSKPDINPANVNVSTLVRMIMRDRSNPDIIQLGSLQPDPDLLPIDKLNLTLSAVVRRDRRKSSLYDELQGYKPLRVQIAKRLLSAGCAITPDELIITSGCAEAVMLSLIATCNPGDAIAIESPVFFNLLQLLEVFKAKAVEIPSHPNCGIIIEALRDAIEEHPIKACFVSPNFSTPLGSCMPDENKKLLVDLLSEHEIPLIEDDIYGDIYFSSERPVAAKSFDKKGLVLLCSSFSKTLAPGYRVGWVTPGRFKNRIELAKSVGNFATSTPPQMAIADFLANGGYDHHLRKIRRLYAQKISLMAQAIEKFFPEGTRVTNPNGGISLWVEFPKYVDSLKLYALAHKHGISFVPGPLFSAKGKYRNFIRLNAAYWSEKAEKALATIGYLAAEMKDN